MFSNRFLCTSLALASLVWSALAVDNDTGIDASGMTLVIQNRHHKPISLSDDTYKLMAEELTLATGQHKTFQTGPWMGNLKVNQEEDGNTGQDTLVEFNVEKENGITMDVSYIAAFTVPVVCGCQIDGAKNVTLVTGCNIDLKKLNGGSCPPDTHNGHGGCMNPMRNRPAEIGASHFFKPCEGAAYTHEGDHATTQNAELCREGPIVCCIGTDCPPSIKQKDFNGTAHDLYADDTLGGVFAPSVSSKHQNATRTFLSLSDLLAL